MNQILIELFVEETPKPMKTKSGISVTNLDVSFLQKGDIASTLEGLDCKAYGKLADQIVANVEKGDRILARGMIRSRTRKLSNGEKMRIPYVQVVSVTFLTKFYLGGEVDESRAD